MDRQEYFAEELRLAEEFRQRMLKHFVGQENIINDFVQSKERKIR